MDTALVDGDLVAYINAASAEGDPLEIALLRCEMRMADILDAVRCTKHRVFLSGGANFRKQINVDYKANRRQPKPIHLEACREFLIKEWNAEVTEGYEADDALGCEQTENTIICSLDKDLRMIDGKHFSWEIVRNGKVLREATEVEVSYTEGIKTFYKQMLIGDNSDNLIGVDRVGPKGADKIIDPLETEEEMKQAVVDLYNKDLDRFYMNADCFWVWREYGQTYSVREEQMDGG